METRASGPFAETLVFEPVVGTRDVAGTRTSEVVVEILAFEEVETFHEYQNR